MNVLVYSGPGVSQTSLSHTLTSLRALLLPHYTVQTITPHSLALHPWASTCALLVIPGGRDLPYLSSLSTSNAIIKAYVQNGGAFLGLCAGAYYASKRIEWESGTAMEISGDRPLCFYEGISRGCVYPGFQYESEAGARAVALDVHLPTGDERQEGLYYNGGGEFVDVEAVSSAEVLARYADGAGQGKVAAVSCKVGKGKAILWAIHPEYPLTREPASLAISRTYPNVMPELVEQLEHKRWKLMRCTLSILGLNLPSTDPSQSLRPLPQFLTSVPSKAHAVGIIMNALSEHLSQGSPRILQDGNDTFYFRNFHEIADLLPDMCTQQNAEISQALEQPKDVVVCADGRIPLTKNTPLFNIEQYYSDLSSQQSLDKLGVDSSSEWRIGEVLLYGEVVTSTQTMLDKNPKLLSTLPVPLLSMASHQLSGRGRGSNIWLSPAGCLQFSLLLRLSLSSFPAAKLVFVQYLFGLAVVEACRSEAVLGKIGERIRLKWPNDIYAVTEGEGGMKKIGGILVNTSFTGGKVDVVVGCGLNVLNPPPIMSLSHLVPSGISGPGLSMERTSAAIMACFESMWSKFIAGRGSFDPFIELYLESWLHSDQLVTLSTTEPPIPVRIVGITADHGLLRTVPVNTGSWSSRGEPYIDLQPDGNSFDLMAGLIRTKT